MAMAMADDRRRGEGQHRAISSMGPRDMSSCESDECQSMIATNVPFPSSVLIAGPAPMDSGIIAPLHDPRRAHRLYKAIRDGRHERANGNADHERHENGANDETRDNFR